MKRRILVHCDGAILMSDNPHDWQRELESLMDMAGFATCDCEMPSVEDERQLDELLRELNWRDPNGYCDLTDKPFTQAELMAAVQHGREAGSR